MAESAWIPRWLVSEERGTGSRCFLDRVLGLGKMACLMALGARRAGRKELSEGGEEEEDLLARVRVKESLE